jgi:hypothetical protein
MFGGNLGDIVLQHLQSLAPQREALYQAIQADHQQTFVYYVCPLSNLRRIAADGILSHAGAPTDRTDLSGQSVQARRARDLQLPGPKEVRLHQCVNFFWNPLNWTFRAFQHHGLLRAASSNNPDAGVVCLLELPLARLLAEPDCLWTLAPQNFAGGSYASYSPDAIRGERTWPDGSVIFDWPNIFGVAESNRELNRKRSAEFIVFRESDPVSANSAPIPFDWVNRIIAPPESIQSLTDDQVTFLTGTGKLVTRGEAPGGVPVFFPRDELLKAEQGFVHSLLLRKRSDSAILAKIRAALIATVKFEQAHPALTPTVDNFASSRLADGPHGTLHSARVMFWAAFLAQFLADAERDRMMPALIAAAAIHDLRRTSNEANDIVHGAASVDLNRGKIEAALGDPVLVRSCLEAVRLHCLPDDQCANPDFTWQILKDADALDRGRFDRPNSPAGCEKKFFRTEILRTGDPHLNIAWMAFYLPKMTRYTPTELTPCRNLELAVDEGVKAFVASRKGASVNATKSAS